MALDSASEASPLLGPSKAKESSSVLRKEVPPQPSRPGPCHSLSLVTVEPAIFLLSVGYGIELIFKTKLLVDKTCSIQLHYSSDVCSNLDSGNYQVQQDTVQKLTTNYNLYCQLIEMLPGALIMMLLGTWGDTRSRRLPLLLPIAGSTLKSLGLVCNAYWWSLPPIYVPLSYIPYGLSGGMMGHLMASYAYVSEYSGLRGRTSRLSIVSMMMFAAMPIGNFLGATLFSHGGYFAVFGSEFITSFIAFIYILIRLWNEKPKSVAGPTEDGIIVTLLYQLRRSVATVVRRRANGNRTVILGHISCIFLYLISYGFANFLYLYTRKKFDWDYETYTIWSISNSIATIIAMALVLPLLSLRCQVEDTVLGFIGAASHTFFGVMVGTAPRAWILYLASVVSAGGGFAITSSRGALSKLVAPDELGAVFSVVAVFESIAPVITSPIYTLIYNNTLEVFPGTIFVISGGVTLVVCCLYTWLATAFPSSTSVGPKEK